MNREWPHLFGPVETPNIGLYQTEPFSMRVKVSEGQIRITVKTPTNKPVSKKKLEQRLPWMTYVLPKNLNSNFQELNPEDCKKVKNWVIESLHTQNRCVINLHITEIPELDADEVHEDAESESENQKDSDGDEFQQADSDGDQVQQDAQSDQQNAESESENQTDLDTVFEEFQRADSYGDEDQQDAESESEESEPKNKSDFPPEAKAHKVYRKNIFRFCSHSVKEHAQNGMKLLLTTSSKKLRVEENDLRACFEKLLKVCNEKTYKKDHFYFKDFTAEINKGLNDTITRGYYEDHEDILKLYWNQNNKKNPSKTHRKYLYQDLHMALTMLNLHYAFHEGEQNWCSNWKVVDNFLQQKVTENERAQKKKKA